MYCLNAKDIVISIHNNRGKLICRGGLADLVINNVQTQLKAEDPGLNPVWGYDIDCSNLKYFVAIQIAGQRLRFQTE